jgi:uncharacterized protein YegP (UPF0339 family)
MSREKPSFTIDKVSPMRNLITGELAPPATREDLYETAQSTPSPVSDLVIGPLPRLRGVCADCGLAVALRRDGTTRWHRIGLALLTADGGYRIVGSQDSDYCWGSHKAPRLGSLYTPPVEGNEQNDQRGADQMADRAVVEVYEAEDGWRWHVKAANGRIVAESGEAYASESNAVRGFRTAWTSIAEIIAYQRAPSAPEPEETS